MDPNTGKIDLDLVTTGISSSGRAVHEQKRNALRQMINELDKVSFKWIELYRAFGDQSDKKVGEVEFTAILIDLVDENFIHMTGRTNADRIVRKIRL
jgi:DNA replication licensing factor MCM4